MSWLNGRASHETPSAGEELALACDGITRHFRELENMVLEAQFDHELTYRDLLFLRSAGIEPSMERG